MATGTEGQQRSWNGPPREHAFQTFREDDGIDRVAIIWRAKLRIAAFAVLVAALTFGICQVVPKTFSSAAIVRITLPPPSQAQISSQSVTAASDLAGQYSQLATLSPVLNAAAARSGTPEQVLASSVSAGTVGGQNLISVTAQARTPADSGTRASAVARALTTEVNRDNTSQATSYRNAVQKQLSPLDKQILGMRNALGRLRTTSRAAAADETVLANLLVQRQQVLSTIAQNAAAEPTADVVSSAGPGGQIQPRATLYTAVAFIVGLLLAAQLAVTVERFRLRTR
jgi:uncharacterized protein involved in exopolysaccharide biosynthesis